MFRAKREVSGVGENLWDAKRPYLWKLWDVSREARSFGCGRKFVGREVPLFMKIVGQLWEKICGERETCGGKIVW